MTDTNYYKDCNKDNNGVSGSSQIPTKRYPKKTKGTACCELLQQIKSLTYLVSDEEPLQNIHKPINIILDELKGSTMMDFDLVINKSEKK